MGLVHIYCGDGKGKTTAAIGLSIRAAGSGKNVIFCQFMKGRDTSEIKILKEIKNIYVLRHNEDFGFFSSMSDETKQKAKNAYASLLESALKKAKELKNCLLVLDEITYIFNYGFCDIDKFLEFLNNIPQNTEVVMTGRNPDERLVKRADYVSEIKKIKHPFDRGIYAREGIEY